MSFEDKSPEKIIVQVAIDSPLNQLFDYAWHEDFATAPQKGQIVQVSFGRQECIGVVMQVLDKTDYDLEKIKKVQAIAPLQPISSDVMAMAEFAAIYYQRPIGEVLIPSIPKMWRQKNKWELLGKEKRLSKTSAATKNTKAQPGNEISLNEEQLFIVEKLWNQSISKKFSCNLLQGITGSGKTLTYLRWLKKILDDDESQVMIMVPEINLTPQLESSVEQAFPGKKLVVMHSGITDRTRADNWEKAHSGKAQIILGTRMAVATSAPNLKAIVVDEEHDLSYKQQEGVRYSARDLAVWRGKKLNIPVVLASATPSLETWFHAQEKRYEILSLKERAAKNAKPPLIQILDLKQEQKAGKKNEHGISEYLLNELQKNIEQGRQSIIYINRRGYSPVLNCQACGWLSDCVKCSAHMVLHKITEQKKNLCCHHCGVMRPVQKVCPDCGNTDLSPLGKGTQKIEEFLSERFPKAKILRIDADTTRTKGSAESLFSEIHDGDADIIVGTQMIAKGHDYQSVSLVGVIDADASLFSQDFRASERLFAQLMQVAGRAGRSEEAGESKVIIQTNYPEASPYKYLRHADVDGFLEEIKNERQLVGLPPFSYQALVHGEHKTLVQAIDMLKDASQLAKSDKIWPANAMLSDVIPRAMVRIAGKERAQMLVESESRQDLQKSIEILQHYLTEAHTKRKGVGWYIERDPISI
ncbi:replication restart helicase PriA [Polynucleobacter cosmopolitanus]|uniref:Replication restart protein PriA n=1 Tax=Polynucleobacter cosmopolitanus TaxID=351345 RepID=A0A229FV89_9BURK|nr:primosomal protein N' [Polynucleobacter cosmopolitanus]OXL15931.1 primosomal protein N' [Polynucleobacter cosmopolitanus]